MTTETVPPPTVEIVCSKTGVKAQARQNADGSPRMPRGWKEFAGAVWSPEAWKKAYRTRALTFPVVGVEGIEKKEFYARLKVAWTETTALANWIVAELAKGDVIRMPGDQKMPGMVSQYLYPKARAVFPAVDTAVLVSVLHDVEGKYRKLRYKALWTREISLPSVRYPYPVPINSQRWKAEYNADNRPMVTLPMGGSRIGVVLKGGSEMRYMLGHFKKVVTGEARHGTVTLYRRRANLGDNRGAVAERAETRERAVWRVMLKITADIPTEVRAGLEGDMPVVLGGPVMVTALPEGRDPWILTGDECKQWIIGHKVRLMRLAVDRKYEKRWPKRHRMGMQSKTEAVCRKQADRIATWIHTSAKLLAEFAVRQKVASLTIERIEPWIDFPWSRWLEVLRQKLEERSIDFVIKDESGEDAEQEAMAPE